MDLPRAGIARRLRKFRSPLPGSSLSVTELREVFEQLVATTWKETWPTTSAILSRR